MRALQPAHSAEQATALSPEQDERADSERRHKRPGRDPTEPGAGSSTGGDVKLALPLSRPLITTNVAEVEVWLDGDRKCTTPCQLEIPVGDDSIHEIRLKKEGYIDVMQNWRPLTITDDLPPMPDMKPLGGSIDVSGAAKKRRKKN